MTISPPSNVRLSPDEPARVLGCGVDSLVLAIDVRWGDDAPLLVKLAELKGEAVSTEKRVTGRIIVADGSSPWLFLVKPFGAKGYAYLIDSHSMAWRVGDWAEPRSRPSVMVEIRAEALWTHAPSAIVDRVTALIRAGGGEVVTCKVSRADLCVDVLLRMSDWDREVRENVVSRADHRAPYFSKKRRTGIHVGKGAIVGRLYDKPLEIAVNGGKKLWMFDVWEVDSAADDHRIIRVEFEVKREAIKELGINTFDDLMQSAPRLWAYCTHKWLRMADDPDKHPTRQKLLPWWPIVQQGYTGAQKANPLIRARAVRADEAQLCTQLLGQLTSLVALHRQGELLQPGDVLDMNSHLALIVDTVRRHGWNDCEFTERVKRKQAKVQRHAEKFAEAERARAQAGVSLKRSNASGRNT